ncbi:Cytochrome P450 [Macrophomina phaseolina MS6]|uniref:Cytochrome P450 n=2 Tax=Macrophomina phaseolina TaxID=35725 RepID=K2RGW8_MACPH|nr:Cytochrome P450 [Macrophomina phaseolina MS6]KAH7060547.1 cytochrome P450 [Macrophomina phaseolina]
MSPALFTCLVALLSIAAYALHRLYFDPLSRFPGPKAAALTRVWYFWHLARGDLPLTVRKLHDQYGPFVRIAPDELSCISPAAWRDVYTRAAGRPEMQKDPRFFEHDNLNGHRSIVGADIEEHKRLRKMMAHGFSDQALREQRPLLSSYIDVLMAKLDDLAQQGQPADLVSWYNFYTFDVIGHLTFGSPFGCLATSALDSWIAVIFDSIRAGLLSQAFSHWPVLQPFAGLLLPRALQARLSAHNAATQLKTSARIAAQKTTTTPDFLGKLIANDLPADSIAVNARTLVTAGSETAASVMSALTFLLLTHRACLGRLGREVRDAFASAEDIAPEEVARLPYLEACIRETFRMRPPVAGAVPRVTPAGAGAVVDGTWVPGGVSVGVWQLAAYRSAANFADADRFVPERWLDDAPAQFARDRKEVVQPFSVGARDCIGRNLAWLELRLVIANLLWRFDMELDPQSARWDEQKVYFNWERKPLWVKLKKRVSGDSTDGLLRP